MKAKQAVIIMLAAGLGACGGSSSSDDGPKFTTDDGPSAAEGLYNGSTDQGQDVSGVVLDTGEYYFLYSPQGGTLLNDGVAGVINGTSTAENGDFGSTDARDYEVGGQGNVFNAEIDATYTAGQNLTGDVIYDQDPPGTVGFTTGYDSAYDQEPDLGAAAATYDGYAATMVGQQAATVEIAGTGDITGESGSNPGCSFSGSATERDRGNILNITLTFPNSTDCAQAYRDKTLEGIAYHDAGNDSLTLAVKTSDRSVGAFFVGQSSSP